MLGWHRLRNYTAGSSAVHAPTARTHTRTVTKWLLIPGTSLPGILPASISSAKTGSFRFVSRL